MHPLRRVFVVSFLAAVIGVQAFIAIPPGRHHSWFWPFMDYPMYSGAHHEGEEVSFHRLEGTPCDGVEPVALTNTDLGILWFTFQDLLSTSAREGRDPGGRLTTLLEDALGGTLCGARVYQRTVVVGRLPEGGPASVPWRPVLDLRVE